MVEPLFQTIAFAFHERAWAKADADAAAAPQGGTPA
jgi:uncharacterized membrane protein